MLLHKVSLKPKPESRTIRIETSGSFVTTPLKASVINRGKNDNIMGKAGYVEDLFLFFFGLQIHRAKP